jgi:hypothetical protein
MKGVVHKRAQKETDEECEVVGRKERHWERSCVAGREQQRIL